MTARIKTNSENFLVVSCVFPPEPLVSARTSADIVQELIKRQQRVKVITSFPNRPGGRLYPGYFRHLFKVDKEWDGIEIIRCFSFLSSESSFVSRFLENISFGLTSGWRVLMEPRPSVIYANTWPIFATGVLCIAAKLRRIPLVISVQDLYPESIAAQGRISRTSPAIRLIECIDALIARSVHHIIIISERFADLYRQERRVKVERLSIVPNWVDSHLVDIYANTNEFRNYHKIAEDSFLLVYAGNIGVAASVETVISALSYSTDIPNIHLLVAGDGSQLAACKQLSQECCPDHVTFHNPWLADETSVVLRSADVLILPTRGKQSMASVPSKLITYMLAARPVIAMALPDSEVADLVVRSNCGWIVTPDQPYMLANQIREVFLMDRGELDCRGAAGREYALQHLTREVCLPKILTILGEVAA